MHLCVNEIDPRPVGIHKDEEELDELQIGEMTIDPHIGTLVRELFEGLAIGNCDSAVTEAQVGDVRVIGAARLNGFIVPMSASSSMSWMQSRSTSPGSSTGYFSTL